MKEYNLKQMIKSLYVVIILDDLLFALDASYYVKTLKEMTVACISTGNKGFLGLVEDKQDMIPVFNPKCLLDLECEACLQSDVIVVLKYLDKRFGILVDEFVDIVAFDTIDKMYYPELSKHIIGTGMKHDIPMTLIDLQDTLYEEYIEHFE